MSLHLNHYALWLSFGQKRCCVLWGCPVSGGMPFLISSPDGGKALSDLGCSWSQTWVWSPPLPLPLAVILSKLLVHLAEPQSPTCGVRIIIARDDVVNHLAPHTGYTR